MTEAAKKFLATLTVCGLVTAALAQIGCGGSSGGSRSGTGGATATGGTTAGTGGTTATGGRAGGGGATGTGGSAGLSCAPPVTATAILTDFSDWSAMTGKWGMPAGVFGGIFSYHGAASTATAVVDTTAGNFHLTGTVMPGSPTTSDGYIGAGLAFNVCATVATFAGIEFAVAGSTGGCALEVQLQTYTDRPATSTPAGGCSGSCTSPVKRNLGTSGPVRVMFSELTGGTPSPFSAAELVQVQWQLTIPAGVDGGIQTPCAVDMTFDNVVFVP